jgi:hypothetical protein
MGEVKKPPLIVSRTYHRQNPLEFTKHALFQSFLLFLKFLLRFDMKKLNYKRDINLTPGCQNYTQLVNTANGHGEDVSF